MARKAGGGKAFVLGIAEIDKKMRRLEPKIAKQVVRKEIREAMKPILAAAKEAAPVGETGQLKAAIRLRVGKVKRGTGQIKFVVMIGKGFFKGDQYYGGFVHFGTNRMHARLFLTAVYERLKDSAKSRAIQGILAGLDRAIKGA